MNQQAGKKEPKQYNLLDAKIAELQLHIDLVVKLSMHRVPLSIPNPDGTDQWTTFRDAHEEFGSDVKNLPPDKVDARTYAVQRVLLQAYETDDKKLFNETVKHHLTRLEQEDPAQMQFSAKKSSAKAARSRLPLMRFRCG